MTKVHDGMTDEEAGRAIAAILGGVLETISRMDDGGWEVEIKHIQRYTLDMLRGYDERSLDYLLLAVENDDERGHHREIVRMTKAPSPEGTGIVLEGVYRRPLGERADADATFYGTFITASVEEWEKAVQTARNRYSDRTIEEAVELLDQTQNIVLSAVNHAPCGLHPRVVETITRKVAAMNRMIVDMGVGDAA